MTGSCLVACEDSGNTLTLSGGIDISTPSHNALLIAGAGNITETGKINIGNVTTASGNITSTGSGGVLTKNGTGTLSITGANTSALDGITMTLGNITVGDGTTTTLVQSGPLSSSTATNTLTINANSTVQAFYATGTTTTFTGMMAGAGTFQKDGAGTLVFNTSFNAQAAGLTLIISGGEVDLTNSAHIFVGTIHITGNTILDFDSSSSTWLQSSTLIIDPGVSVTVNNWASETDFWMVQSSGTPSAPGTAGVFKTGVTNAVQNATGVNPESTITFANWSNLNTTWIGASYGGYTTNEIRPIPEPSTYGVLFLSSCLALLGWRRYSRRTAVGKN